MISGEVVSIFASSGGTVVATLSSGVVGASSAELCQRPSQPGAGAGLAGTGAAACAGAVGCVTVAAAAGGTVAGAGAFGWTSGVNCSPVKGSNLAPGAAF